MRVMFCPQCKAEYRPGFKHCVDCDVDLVDALPIASPNSPENEGWADDLRTIWVGTNQEVCVSLCRSLRAAGIAYKVSQDFKVLGEGTAVKFRYGLGVAAENEKRARELLELPETLVEEDDESDEPDEEQALFELPEGPYVPQDPHKRDSYLDPWYPEDATIEVWTQPASDTSSGIELSLKENRIRSRIDLQEDGSKKYFVFPEDEADAREIVRELEEDSPPR